MPHFRALRWVVLLWSVSSAVAAQDTHHQTLAVGDRALGMGGAFTGLATDQAAAWYNPAGLAFLEGDTLSGSLLLHAFEDIRLAGGELRLGQKRRSNFPLFATGVLRVGRDREEGRHAFGVIVLRPLQVTRRFELAVRGPGGDPSTLFVDTTEHQTLFGFMWASRLTQRFAIGASLMTTIRRFEHRESVIAVMNGAADTSIRSGLTEVVSNHLVLRLGALFRNGRFRFGLLVQPQGLPMRQEGHVDEHRVRNRADGNEAFFGEVSPAARVVVPWIVRMGASYQFGRDVTISGDLQFVAPIGRGSFVNAAYPGEEADEEPAVGSFVDLETKRRPALNGAIGFEWRASRGVLFRFGGFTDLSTARQIPARSDRYQVPNIPSIGGSGSIGLDLGEQDINIGLAGVGGRGEALMLDPRQGIDDPGYRRVEAKRRVIYFFVTGSLTGE
ncbi:MAG: hypothetical protein AAGE52_08990 [Myxococcota bacterium]